jgi:DNA-binding transcriptional regulator YdaS (Cro superfamily)
VPGKRLSDQELIALALPRFGGKQKALADHLGRREPSVSQWVNGARAIPAHTRRLLEQLVSAAPMNAPTVAEVPRADAAPDMPPDLRAHYDIQGAILAELARLRAIITAQERGTARSLRRTSAVRSNQSVREKAGDLPHEVQVAFDQVSRMWFKNGKRHPELWRAFRVVLNDFVPPAELEMPLPVEPPEPLPVEEPVKKKRRKRGGGT